MVKILGTGTTTDGQDYVMVDKTEFEELQAFGVLLDFAKQHGKEKEVLSKLTGGSRKVSRNRRGIPARVPKELKEPIMRALDKLKYTKGVTEENSFYKLRDWTKVKI